MASSDWSGGWDWSVVDGRAGIMFSVASEIVFGGIVVGLALDGADADAALLSILYCSKIH